MDTGEKSQDATVESRQGLPVDRFLNRELSWLAFNDRVLEEARDSSVPLLERMRFLAIVASNLDEFFMVRVALVRRALEAGVTRKGPDGLQPKELMEEIKKRVHQAHEALGTCYRNDILPSLEKSGVYIVTDVTASVEQRAFAVSHCASVVRPLLTPVSLNGTQSFPPLENGALYFCIAVSGKKRSSRARLLLLQIPSAVIGRFVRVPSAKDTQSVMMVDDIIRLSLNEILPGMHVEGCYEIKIVRDSELDLDEIGSQNLLKAIVAGLARRKRGAATRFLYDPAMPDELLSRVIRLLGIRRRQVFVGARYHSFSDFGQLPSLVNRPDLLYPPMPSLAVRRLDEANSVMGEMRKRDILLHHPYESFSPVVRFLEEAAHDPTVIAIKGTLYRIGADSRIAAASVRAARSGKQVSVLVELKARFDEERNIGWARGLEEAGAHIIYGVRGLKTHCKMMMVLQRDRTGVIRRYCHFGTGNYNERNASIYTDFSLLTCHEGITADAFNLFQRITAATSTPQFRFLLVAPEYLREEFVRRIRREADHAHSGAPARIVAKMNSLVDPDMIDELYRASRAGVCIDLIVRGICCLRPGVQGLSERIRVVSIIDRYLEHSRVYWFENGGEQEVFLASADWMQRNLNNRIEIAFPILDPLLRKNLTETLELQLRDTAKGRRLRADGLHERPTNERSCRSQFDLYEQFRASHS